MLALTALLTRSPLSASNGTNNRLIRHSCRDDVVFKRLLQIADGWNEQVHLAIVMNFSFRLAGKLLKSRNLFGIRGNGSFHSSFHLTSLFFRYSLITFVRLKPIFE